MPWRVQDVNPFSRIVKPEDGKRFVEFDENGEVPTSHPLTKNPFFTQAGVF